MEGGQQTRQSNNKNNLLVVATDKHVEYCWETLINSLNGYNVYPTPEFPELFCPLFVSWYKITYNNSNGYSQQRTRLRGCIGTLEAQRLPQALRDYTLSSAFRDNRFLPISNEEVQDLICSVSLLTNFEKGSNYLDWEIGIHGLIIRFLDPSSKNKKERQATFLPDVIQKEGYDKITAIDMLIQKSGFEGRITEELRQSIVLERYQSTLFEMTYEEYAHRKKIAGKNGYRVNI
eukprot:TRINITY_DN42529_c0_g2_i1.p1 TRINITY_DN42529_c0_g2~~TRINITY_DN42529_c0_g2_i1.p1  ORF type:complete len:233 (-),score=20.12 TRINITY_DN42529_c0_g2_i1:373-1071(-)